MPSAWWRLQAGVAELAGTLMVSPSITSIPPAAAGEVRRTTRTAIATLTAMTDE